MLKTFKHAPDSYHISRDGQALYMQPLHRVTITLTTITVTITVLAIDWSLPVLFCLLNFPTPFIIHFCLFHIGNGDWMGILISWMNMWRHILWEIMRLHFCCRSSIFSWLYWSFIFPWTHLFVMIRLATHTLQINSFYIPGLFIWLLYH